MLTLALDTTTEAGSVAVCRGERLLTVLDGDGTRTHGERLPGEIERALRVAGVTATELELLAVATGPGAFTGLRIGLATIQGLAMVIGCPVVGVSALDALAAAALDEAHPGVQAVAAWMDARRGEVFAAFYHRDAAVNGVPQPAADPMVGTPDVVFALLPANLAPHTQFVGEGARRYHSEIVRLAAGQAVVGDRSPALAPFIARLGQHRAVRGAAGPPHALQPLYVRRSDAELERARRVVAATPSWPPNRSNGLP